jgi:hypothetical protein
MPNYEYDCLGRVDKLPEEHDHTGKLEESQIVLCCFLVSGRNATVAFEPVESSLHAVPHLVPVFVILSGLLAILAWRNHRLHAFLFQGLHKVFAVIPFVSDDNLHTNLLHQGRSLGDVMHLSGSENRLLRIPNPSTRRWILLVRPLRERPSTCRAMLASLESTFSWHLPHVDGHA